MKFLKIISVFLMVGVGTPAFALSLGWGGELFNQETHLKRQRASSSCEQPDQIPVYKKVSSSKEEGPSWPLVTMGTIMICGSMFLPYVPGVVVGIPGLFLFGVGFLWGNIQS